MNKLFAFILVLVMGISACGDNSVLEVPKGNAEIAELLNSVSFPTDTITLYGSFIPPASAKNFLVFNDSVKISSLNVLKWTATTIQFIMPDTIASGFVYAIFDKDTTNKFALAILNYMPFGKASIPPGKFVMGSSVGLNDELPLRQVEITRNLIVSDKEITQRLYEYIVKANPSPTKSPSLPVYGITWEEAVLFCNLLSEKDSLQKAYTFSGNQVIWDTNANGWRLPTEAEWEYFARGNANGDFIGNELREVAWYLENSAGQPHSTGTLKANSFGLYDVLGNVREWCWDYYSESYYGVGATTNPTGPEIGTRRVSRGGSFIEGKSYLRLASRKLQSIEAPIGIRIVRNME